MEDQQEIDRLNVKLIEAQNENEALRRQVANLEAVREFLQAQIGSIAGQYAMAQAKMANYLKAMEPK